MVSAALLLLLLPPLQIVYDQEVDTLNQAHEEQREEEKQNSDQKMNEVQVCNKASMGYAMSGFKEGPVFLRLQRPFTWIV